MLFPLFSAAMRWLRLRASFSQLPRQDIWLVLWVLDLVQPLANCGSQIKRLNHDYLRVTHVLPC